MSQAKGDERYIFRRKEQKGGFPSSFSGKPVKEIANQSQGDCRGVCGCEMDPGSDTRSLLCCYVQNQHKHKHYWGKAVSDEQQIFYVGYFLLCFEGGDSSC